MKKVWFLALALSGCAAGPQKSAHEIGGYFLPTTISPEARATLTRLIPIVEKSRDERGIAHTAADFARRNAENEARAAATNPPLLQALGVEAKAVTLGDVPAIELTPPVMLSGGIVLYVHGGAWVGGSAASTLGLPARISAALERRVISVDYTLAPAARWPQITDQVVAAYAALIASGVVPQQIVLLGDSAGGNLIATSTLKLRDQGEPMPAALVMLSPGTDLTQSSDTFTTLRYADPALGPEDLLAAISLYADAKDWTNPYVSPVYGDFAKGFPPSLIQVGTKEMLLSDSVRLYQAIKQAGVDAELDVYEGMPHVWHSYLSDAPETKAAFAEIRRFVERRLAPKPSSPP